MAVFLILIALMIAGYMISRYALASEENADKTAEPTPPDPLPDPLPELLPTGDKAIDLACHQLWESRKFYELSTYCTLEAAKLDDWEPSEKDLRMLRILRRNQILSHVLGQIQDMPDTVSMSGIEPINGDPHDASCIYSEPSLPIPVSQYLANPDVFPCTVCRASRRKYFCDVILRPYDSLRK